MGIIILDHGMDSPKVQISAPSARIVSVRHKGYWMEVRHSGIKFA